MSRILVVAVTLNIFFATMLILASSPHTFAQKVEREVRTITVPGDYATIQEAINAASNGDTIFVKNGTYYEQVMVNKTVSLLGESREGTIIDGGGVGNVTAVTADSAEIVGFTIQNGGSWPNSGIVLSYVRDCNVSGNNIQNNKWFGVYVSHSSNNTMSANLISGNKYNFGVEGNSLDHFLQSVDVLNLVEGKPVYYLVNQHGIQVPSDAGYVALINCTEVLAQNLILSSNLQGILLVATTNSTLAQNNITNTMDGIELEFSSSNNRVEDNEIKGNGEGIDIFPSSDQNHIIRNNITGNGGCIGLSSSNNEIAENNMADSNHGIDVFGSFNNFTGNTFERIKFEGFYMVSATDNRIVKNNMTNNGYGIYLKVSSDNNEITGNSIVANNVAGIFVSFESDYNLISQNDIKSNWQGIYLSFSSSNNHIIHNNFISNSYHVETGDDCVNLWDNGYPSGGNYWSDYVGSDANHDTIGDSPYIIDSNNRDNYPLMNSYAIPEFPSAMLIILLMMATVVLSIAARKHVFSGRSCKKQVKMEKKAD